MVVRAVITFLCGVGLYTSLFMLNKSRRAARGEIREPSVVKTPRARLFGVPNSLFGIAYYAALAVSIWWVRGPFAIGAVLAAALWAAAVSAFLAYSLLFITRRSCPYCWTSHAVNWSLMALCFWLFLPNVLSKGI
ncbi:MAG: vitamin K epoxide reductase family protein [Candidatus Eremiobacteraeota bacterium]|nr:vitamin K epoxide reductase family protein [Candidatus Eremiobacteraeota bacterium]